MGTLGSSACPLGSFSLTGGPTICEDKGFLSSLTKVLCECEKPLGLSVRLASKPSPTLVCGVCVCGWVGVCVIVFGKYLLGTCRVRNVGVCDTASGHVPLAARPQTHLSLPAADSTGRRWLSVYGTLIYGTLSLYYSTWPSLRLHQVSNSISISLFQL